METGYLISAPVFESSLNEYELQDKLNEYIDYLENGDPLLPEEEDEGGDKDVQKLIGNLHNIQFKCTGKRIDSLGHPIYTIQVTNYGDITLQPVKELLDFFQMEDIIHRDYDRTMVFHFIDEQFNHFAYCLDKGELIECSVQTAYRYLIATIDTEHS